MIKTEEFEYGGGNNSRGPYLWPDDHDALPWIVVLHGLWTRPDARRRGVARHVIEHIRGFELPLYVRVRPAEPEPGPVGVYAPSAPPSSGVAAGAPCALRRAASAAAASESPDQRWLHNSRLRFAQEFVRSTTRRS
jgi:GNAT superfamily N-acetyltransferase